MIINLSETPMSRSEYQHERRKKISQMHGIIDLWDREQIRQYLYDRNKEHPVSDAGMAAVLERFIHANEFQDDEMAEELKKGFDLVLYICRSIKIHQETTDLIYEFIKHYKELIHRYDQQSAQTYYHKLTKAYESSVDMADKKRRIETSMRLKY